jgi:uncharacterized protein YjbI with pentapeptide repeats
MYFQKSLFFECNEDVILERKFCIFHDDMHHSFNENEIRDKFIHKLNYHNQNNINLICIGYNIPSLTIKESIKIGISFIKSNFYGELRINSIFYDDISFVDCQFNNYVDFSNSYFYKMITISNSNFFKSSYFAKTEFSYLQCNDTKFSDIRFSEAKFFSHIIFQKSELNNLFLHGSEFKNGVLFNNCIISGFSNLSAKFCGKTEFHMTTFKSERPGQTYFGDDSSFNGETEFKYNTFEGICRFARLKFVNIVTFENCNFNMIYFHTVEFQKKS